MAVNFRGMDRSLIRRAKARAASVGLTLKQWVTGLIERALEPLPHERPHRRDVAPSPPDVSPVTDPLALRDTVGARANGVPASPQSEPSAPAEPPRGVSGRRDLLPPGGGGSST